MRIFEIDSIHTIEQSFYPNGQVRSHVEMRKNRPFGTSFLYYSNEILKSSGNYIQVNDTIESFSEDLLTGEITFYEKIVDNSPRKEGTWLTYDSLGRVTKLEKYAGLLKPYYSSLFDYNNAPYLTIQKNLDSDTTLNLEFNEKSELIRQYETVEDSLCGSYKEFHSNGKIKLEGTYVLVESEKMILVAEEDLLTGDIIFYEISERLIPKKSGIWLEYNKQGELIKTETF